ncbi:phage tail protein [Escherichia coli]|uniref:phage tail protein n=1 Tax=Escherichia coli TaxID=562 RepID=UPI0038F64829
MNDVTVVTSVTYPSPESLALVADVQYHEPYLSAALNRKFRGIVDPGFYAGFLPKPGGGMNLLITSVDGDKTAGAASVDIGEFYQVTIQHRKDISLALNAGKKYAIVLKGRYLLGEDTYQVNTASHIHAAEFVARTYTDSYQLGDGELLVCTVNIPAGVSTITQEMIDTSERINRTIGIDISDSVTSTRSDVAASSLAVKKAYDLAKSKYTAQDASTTQKGLVQLSSATNSTSEVLAATPKAVKAAYDLANGKYTAQDATTTQKGIVQLSSDTNSTSETLAATPKAVKAAYDLAAGKAPSSHTHPWNQITGVPTASLTAKGITQLSSATNSTSEVLAATPKAVKAAYDLANGKQAADATLTALAALATAADKLPYFTGVDRAALTALTSVGRAILSKPSIQSVLNYLGLGEAAKRNVGNGENQIPDMSFWTVTGGNGNFVIRQPDGLIIQMVTVSISGQVAMNGMTDNAYAITGSNKSYIATATLPFVFPNKVLGVIPLVSTTVYGGVSSNITGSYATAVCSFAAVRGNNTIVFKVDKPLNTAFPSDTSVSALIIGR